jgi:hypothetical protein
MSQPCVKFVASIITYMIFTILVTAATFTFSDEIKSRENFSSVFPQYVSTFAAYVSNQTLMYRYPNADFFIRMHSPSNLDYIITIWIVGECDVCERTCAAVVVVVLCLQGFSGTKSSRFTKTACATACTR